MKKSYVILVLFLFTFSVFAQEKIDYQAITRIKDEGFNRSQVMDILFNLTEVSGPRLSGSTNLKNAEVWAVDKMKEWGIQHANREAWGTFGRGWEIEKSYIAMTSPYYQSIIAVPKAWTPGTNGLIKAEAVLVKASTEEELEQFKGMLKGKIVVLSTGNTELKLRDKRPEARRLTDEDLEKLVMDRHIVESDATPPSAADRAASRALRAMRQKLPQFLMDEEALLVISTSGRGGSYGTLYTSNGASYAVDAKPVLPELEIGWEHMNQLSRLLAADKKVEIEAEVRTKFLDSDTQQYNVIAEIPGTDKKLKNEIVMIGGHLDSWHGATGATDNGASCAVLMEAMRIIKTLDLQPRRTIRIALWSAEEQGLHGSRNYVRNHFANVETMELKSAHQLLSAYYNMDNGAGKIRGIYLQGNDALRPIFETWFAPFKDLGVTAVTTRSTGSTDHIPFDAVGLPGFQFIQDPLDYGTRTHHTNMDVYDRAQKSDLMQAAVVIASLVYHTAQRDEKLPRKALPKARKPVESPVGTRGTN